MYESSEVEWHTVLVVTEIIVKAADQIIVTRTLHVTTTLNSVWHKCNLAEAVELQVRSIPVSSPQYPSHGIGWHREQVSDTFPSSAEFETPG